MNRFRIACAGVLLVAASGSVAKAPSKPIVKVPASALIAAAKSAMLSEIDYGHELCDADRSVDVWLRDVVADTAASVTWRGGGCNLVNDLNPLDAGSKWCGGATIVPKAHPQEPAEIEVYFEAPMAGKPGKPYAFRAVNYDVDGLDYKRDFLSFEYGYRQKYQKDFVQPESRDCD